MLDRPGLNQNACQSRTATQVDDPPFRQSEEKMKVLWTLLKVVLVLLLVIPVSMFVLGTAFSVLGVVFGLAILALRVAVAGLIVYGLFKLGSAIFGGRKQRPEPAEIRALPPVDPYYEAAKRELDRELGHVGKY